MVLRGYHRPSSSEEFRELVIGVLTDLVGCPLHRDLYLYVDRFAHGGMSSGKVSGEWWMDTGLPELIRRFTALREQDEG